MTSTLIDTNVFLDVVEQRQPWFEWAKARVLEARLQGDVVVNAVVFAEASLPYEDENQFRQFLVGAGFAREDVPFDCAFAAGKAQLEYRNRGGVRTTTLPDFLIGAHALFKRYRMLTRDAQRFRTYFPNLEIIAPDTHP